MANTEHFDEINVLASQAEWAWPQALHDIFRPKGINLLFANDANDFVNVLQRKRIHTTIVDTDTNQGALATIKIIRMEYPMIPCVILSSKSNQDLLDKALQLEVFGVIDKPVDMMVLRNLLNRIFIKKYNCNIFSK